ncbi:hypothetical protein J4229_00245 [Candidatus Pacearchaeota archaeon]|nr:hypothetical protein [Candidatus Pacearchaeota archaeon]
MEIKELENIKLFNKNIYVKAFKNLLISMKNNEFNFKDDEKENYYIINEIRLNSHFVHIVPKELINIFNKMKIDNPEDFTGMTILMGKRNNKDIRISCFGVSCSLLTKCIINK